MVPELRDGGDLPGVLPELRDGSDLRDGGELRDGELRDALRDAGCELRAAGLPRLAVRLDSPHLPLGPPTPRLAVRLDSPHLPPGPADPSLSCTAQ